MIFYSHRVLGFWRIDRRRNARSMLSDRGTEDVFYSVGDKSFPTVKNPTSLESSVKFQGHPRDYIQLSAYIGILDLLRCCTYLSVSRNCKAVHLLKIKNRAVSVSPTESK